MPDLELLGMHHCDWARVAILMGTRLDVRRTGLTTALALMFVLAFSLAALLIQIRVGAFSTDRGQTGDEAAHFVTSLMLTEYAHHLNEDPIGFAKSYYVHLPRVAIGHWPPLFEGVQALIFGVFGGNNGVALALQALIAGLMAGLPASVMSRFAGPVAGLLTGLLILFNPLTLFQIDTVMADNLLGLLVFLATLAWIRFYRRRSVAAALAFIAATAAAILTKGSGIALLGLPFAYTVWIKDLRFLIQRRTVLTLGAILLSTAPWYIATYRLAAAGFNYPWGKFTVIAIPYFAKTLLTDFGLLATAGFGWGAVRALRRRVPMELDITAFALTALMQLVFVFIVPADLQARYLIPVYPCAAVVAVWGMFDFVTVTVFNGNRRPTAATCSAAALALISMMQCFRAPHVESFRTQDAFAAVGRTSNPLLLICGAPRFEGAMIATVAQADGGRFFYALRATKLLSSSDFMGRGYRQRFASAADLKAWLTRNQIGWIAIDTSAESMRFPHNRMLLSVLLSDPNHFRLIFRQPRAEGETEMFKNLASAFAPQNLAGIVAAQAPSL